MPLTDLLVGTTANDDTGETLRSGGQKINTNYTFTVTTDTTQDIGGVKTFTGATTVFNGNVGIGTASPTAGTTLQVVGKINSGTTLTAARFNLGFSSGIGIQVITSTDDLKYLRLTRDGVTNVDHKISGSQYQIINFSDGVSLNAGGTSWGSLSDERAKDIIEPISNAVEKVATLRALIGKYKTDDENVRRVFLIAQDVDKVLPEAVDKENPDNLSLRYTEIIPLLVAAIKEQQKEIEKIKIKLNANKG
jgi:hypothetical protein